MSMRQRQLDDRDWRVEVARLAFTADNPKEVLEAAAYSQESNTSFLFGYIHAFVRLTHLGDVNAVAAEFQSSAQSITLKVRKLEDLLECRLFESVGTVSRLTPNGVAYLPRALELFDLSCAFLSRRAATRANYRYIPIAMRDLRHRDGAPQILADFYSAWLNGSQSTSCSRLQRFKPKWILYERRAGVWYSREIGDHSTLAKWYGVEKARRSTGLSVADMISGYQLRDEISFILDSLFVKGGGHYSEVSCELPKPGHQGRVHIVYQRVIVELIDDVGRPVFGSVTSILPITKSADETAWSRLA